MGGWDFIFAKKVFLAILPSVKSEIYIFGLHSIIKNIYSFIYGDRILFY